MKNPRNSLRIKRVLSSKVRAKGLEPSHREAPDPKSGVSTNFTTPAVSGKYTNKCQLATHPTDFFCFDKATFIADVAVQLLQYR